MSNVANDVLPVYRYTSDFQFARNSSNLMTGKWGLSCVDLQIEKSISVAPIIEGPSLSLRFFKSYFIESRLRISESAFV